MIYLDTSSLLKLLLPEPESRDVALAVDAEKKVAVSALTELETRVQLRAHWLGGDLTKRQYEQTLVRFDALCDQDPFSRMPLSGAVFERAQMQLLRAGKKHCRSLDRLHLGAMEELAIARLMTNDRVLSAAAVQLGFVVLTPGQPLSLAAARR